MSVNQTTGGYIHYKPSRVPKFLKRPRLSLPAVAASLLVVAIASYVVAHNPSLIPGHHVNGRPYGIALGDTLPYKSSAQLNSELSGIASMGVSWIRIDMSWADIQPESPNLFSWSRMDRVITTANQYHLHVLAVLAYTPSWARPSGCTDSQMCAPASDAQFAAFNEAAVKRYASQGLDTWEVWNEPNNTGFWEPAPNPVNYTALLKTSYLAIKQADSHALVISGGLGPSDGNPNSISPPNFIADMYKAGAEPYFDAVGYHPYSFPAPPSYVVGWSAWSMMADIPDSVRTQMIANGDAGKKVWVTEYGAPTGGSQAEATPINDILIKNSDHVSEPLQTIMLDQAAESYRSNGWMGNFFWYSYQDLGTSSSTNENFFGLLRHNGSRKPAYYALEKAIDGKSLSN